MEKRKREILAVGLLVVLGIGVAAAMAWYLLVGHSWNKAASHIDEAVGSMEGYTAIVYEGVLPPAKAHSRQLAGSEPPSGDPSEASAAASVRPASAAGQAAGSGSAASSPAGGAVALDAAVQSYAGKGAHVIALHLDDLSRYADPFVVSRDGRRFGICAAFGKYRYVDVRDKVRYLKGHGADYTIVIADDPGIKKGWLGGVDLVVLACNGSVPDAGAYAGSTLIVDSPPVGEVQAVVVSPSWTVTARTVTSL